MRVTLSMQILDFEEKRTYRGVMHHDGAQFL